MAFPLFYILFPVALFAVIYAVFILMDVYHLISFAEVHFMSFFMTFIFLAGIVYISFWTWTLAQPIDWNEPVTIFQSISFSPEPETF
ncbi:MAG: hypothetical protein AAB666_00250 [Patescibacteria group bacterium]